MQDCSSTVIRGAVSKVHRRIASAALSRINVIKGAVAKRKESFLALRLAGIEELLLQQLKLYYPVVAHQSFL